MFLHANGINTIGVFHKKTADHRNYNLRFRIFKLFFLVSVVFGLIRALDWDIKVVRLLLGQLCKLCTESAEVKHCDFFIQFFGQGVYVGFQVFFCEHYLCERLVGEAVTHDKAWVARRTAEVNETAFGEQNDRSAGF